MENPTTVDGMKHQILTTVLAVRSVETAIDFYARIFAAKEMFRSPGPGGAIAFAQIRIGNTNLFLSGEGQPGHDVHRSPDVLKGSTCTIYAYVDDADAVFAQAVAGGAVGLSPVPQQHWGDREGFVRDPFGHFWAIATRTAV